ncbi:MAG TPA: hypothetical protein VKK79_06270, partial [Candidatus Lokiarchaeia archaeon]|nr:hypothetical protein [Candidatus Lokiarchaeia archaeon]
GLKIVYCKVHNNTLTTIATANITYAAPLLPVPTIWHAGNITTYTNQTGATVSWVISGSNVTGITTTVYRNDAAVAWGPWTSGSPVSVSLDGLAPATYNFTIVATDMFGDTARDTTFVTVITSQTAPVPAVPVIWHAGNVTVYTNQTGAMVSWVISGSNASGNTVTIFRNGTPVAWGPWTPSLPISISLDGLAPGTYSFTVVATDSFGNTAQDTAFVTVVASQAAPAAPADISASTWVVLIVGAIEGIVFSVAVVIMVVSLKRSRAGNARVIPETMTGDRELNTESDSTEE